MRVQDSAARELHGQDDVRSAGGVAQRMLRVAPPAASTAPREGELPKQVSRAARTVSIPSLSGITNLSLNFSQNG